MDNIHVLKFGGNAIRGREDLMRLSKEIAVMVSEGKRVILVHGGGPEINEEMEARGFVPQKVCGMRITDGDVLDIVETVLRRLNADVVECLQESGVTALGIPGYFCTICTRKPPFKAVEDGKEIDVDLGLVGEVQDVDPSSLYDLMEQGILPVIYPIGKDRDGRMLNINADTMVAGIAAGVDCVEMVAITDVPGILADVKDPSSKYDNLTLEQVDALIADGTISGGMIPKVDACRKALLAGVASVRMVNGRDKEGIMTGPGEGSRGTVITK